MSADGISAYADLRMLTGNPEAKVMEVSRS